MTPDLYTAKNEHVTRRWWLLKGISFSRGSFWGMLVFRGVNARSNDVNKSCCTLPTGLWPELEMKYSNSFPVLRCYTPHRPTMELRLWKDWIYGCLEACLWAFDQTEKQYSCIKPEASVNAVAGAARHQGQWTTTAKQIAYEADWSAKASDPLGLVQPFVKVEVLTVGLSEARTNFVRDVYFNIAWNGLPNPTRKHSLPSVQLSILHQHLPTEPSLNKDARSLRQWDSNGDPYQIKVVYTLRRLLLHLLRLGGSLRWWPAPAKYAWWL